MSVYLHHLPKHGGGRLKDVQTFRASCNATDATAVITVNKTLKAPEEAAYSAFVHVLEGLMLGSPVVIKLQTVGRMSDREAVVAAYFKANPRRNVAVPICEFKCPHDLVTWMNPIVSSRRLCDGDTMLSVIVMEHIPHNLIEYLDKVKVSEIVRVSILKQLGFTLIQLHVIDRMTHGDIGSGNMMLDVSEPRRNEYVIGGKTYSVDTQGFEPILIDFQISTAYRGKPSKDLLIAEITLAYDILERWIHWDLKELIAHMEEAKTLRELTVLIDSIV